MNREGRSMKRKTSRGIICGTLLFPLIFLLPVQPGCLASSGPLYLVVEGENHDGRKDLDPAPVDGEFNAYRYYKKTKSFNRDLAVGATPAKCRKGGLTGFGRAVLENMYRGGQAKKVGKNRPVIRSFVKTSSLKKIKLMPGVLKLKKTGRREGKHEEYKIFLKDPDSICEPRLFDSGHIVSAARGWLGSPEADLEPLYIYGAGSGQARAFMQDHRNYRFEERGYNRSKGSDDGGDYIQEKPHFWCGEWPSKHRGYQIQFDSYTTEIGEYEYEVPAYQPGKGWARSPKARLTVFCKVASRGKRLKYCAENEAMDENRIECDMRRY